MELIFCCVKGSDDLMVNIIKEEINNQQAKRERIKQAYINGSFTLEEHDKEVRYVDDTIAELERQILEQEQIKELKFTPKDILIKRDMDFINRVKLPMLYKAIVECWEDLDREEKSRIIMNYIDDIKLTKNNKEQYVVDSVNFRSTFYKDFKKLYDDGFIDWKRKFIYNFNGIRIDSKIRYSEYLPFKKVYEHIKRLSDCYDVAFYFSNFYVQSQYI